jgi:hypothetical protein
MERQQLLARLQLVQAARRKFSHRGLFYILRLA